MTPKQQQVSNVVTAAVVAIGINITLVEFNVHPYMWAANQAREALIGAMK